MYQSQVRDQDVYNQNILSSKISFEDASNLSCVMCWKSILILLQTHVCS
uniref:Uncharacterized protein n=1 Tax=Rhizophora mucronata TaxID=61149 RepID=A0A2P2JX93_RHIMU